MKYLMDKKEYEFWTRFKTMSIPKGVVNPRGFKCEHCQKPVGRKPYVTTTFIFLHSTCVNDYTRQGGG